MGEKFSTKDFVRKIEKLAKERITQEGVVPLNEFRKISSGQKIPRILVLEDDETVRGALQKLLTREGYKVILASDATQLAKLIGDDPIDLILLDVGLPWINGLEVAKLMRESQDLKHIPIIFLSGKTSPTDIKAGFQVGASDYIKKPFQISDVIKSVKTLLHLNDMGT